jgi:hypothetical protein
MILSRSKKWQGYLELKMSSAEELKISDHLGVGIYGKILLNWILKMGYWGAN